MTNLPVRRDSSRRVLGGVCAGLARSWNVDPLLIRAGLIVAAVVTSGLALFAYLALWLVVPTDRLRVGVRRAWTPTRALLALALLAGATALLAPDARPVTIGFVVVGLVALALSSGRAHRQQTRASSVLPAEPQWRQPPLPGQSVASAPLGYAPQSFAYALPPTYVSQPVSGLGQRRPRTWRPVVLVTLVAWVGLWMADAAGVGVRSVAYPAAALAAIALGLVAASRPSRATFGRPRGLVGVGLVLALVTMSMMQPAQITVPTESHQVVTSASDLPSDLDLGVGTHTLDLGTLVLSHDRTITVTQDAGTLTLILPTEAGVKASYTVDAGSITTPTHKLNGMDQAATESFAAPAGKPTLTVVVRLSVGSLEVQR